MALSYRGTSSELPNKGTYFLEGEYLRANATTNTSENTHLLGTSVIKALPYASGGPWWSSSAA